MDTIHIVLWNWEVLRILVISFQKRGKSPILVPYRPGLISLTDLTPTQPLLENGNMACFLPEKEGKYFSHYSFLYLKFSYLGLRYPWYSRIKALENPLEDLAEPRKVNVQVK